MVLREFNQVSSRGGDSSFIFFKRLECGNLSKFFEEHLSGSNGRFACRCYLCLLCIVVSF